MEIYDKEETKLKKTKKILNNYNCSWCGYAFKQYVCKSGKQGKEGTRGGYIRPGTMQTMWKLFENLVNKE